MPADVLVPFNNPYFHFHGIARTEGRYVLSSALFAAYVAHNLPLSGKLIPVGLCHPIMFMLKLLWQVGSVLNSASNLAFALFSQTFSEVQVSCRAFAQRLFQNASDVSRHGFPTAILAYFHPL